MKRNLVLFHAGCMDGFTAAYAASQVLDPTETEYRAVAYHDPPPTTQDVEGREVYVLDFSYSRAVVAEWAAVANRIVMIDHHKTMAEGWGLPVACRMTGQEAMRGVEIHYDPERSGAGLAWHYFKKGTDWEGEQMPALFAYVEDRDLWRFKLLDSHAVNAYLGANKFSFTRWAALEARLTGHFESVVERGLAIIAFRDQMIEQVAADAVSGEMFGQPVVVCNGHAAYTSELGAYLNARHPNRIAVIWYHAPEGKRIKYSFRSVGRLDASALAVVLGGGGHLNAAGASVVDRGLLDKVLRNG